MLIAGCEDKYPTDTHLRVEFLQNRGAYERAAEEFLRENLWRAEIRRDDTLEVMPQSDGDRDLALLRELMVEEIQIDLVTLGDLGEVAFFNYRRGFVFSGENKGIAFRLYDQGMDLQRDLDRIDLQDEKMLRTRIYRRLEPHWYLFREIFP